jgi:poly(3-hydroxybutyrate) depolymerase
VSLDAAPAHCGACDRACPVRPNAAATCAAGTCGFTCLAGFADCDRDPANGCEVDTRTNTSHCGACGRPCRIGQTCTAGTCVGAGAVCPAGFGDCDQRSGNGCEVHTRTNASHCGACGRPCYVGQTCVAGACVGAGASCPANFADCDGDRATGCEANTAADPAHCGRCDVACAVTNGEPSCTAAPGAAGACGIRFCLPGYQNCDGALANGCETNTNTASAHCGRCGNVCPVGQSCTNGACAAIRCPAGQTLCGSACVDTQRSAAHCGACGRACAAGVSCAGGACGCAAGSRRGGVGDRTVSMRFDGRDRGYTMHVPRSYDPTRRTPVVLAFHGAFDDPQGHRTETGFDALADARNLIVVYPEGIGAPTRSWNAGTCCGPAGALQVDDVGFAAAILDRVEAEYCVDVRREYAEGFSNGGMLAHQIGCRLATRIAAIAAVSGVIASTCNPARAVPVLHIHGTDDAIVGYNGTLLAGLPSVDETVRLWREDDRCSGVAQTVFAQGPVGCIAYSRCATDVEVRRCRIDGGPHHWPAPPWNASAYILDFFARYPLP